MPIQNVEIKARCSDPARVREMLVAQNARSVGTDHQVDTYYSVNSGRLKLRQGNIENSLIYYQRPDQEGPKLSTVALYRTQSSEGLSEVLNAALETLVVVDKHREIYFIDEVKFHIDQVVGLGSFVEIEVIDESGDGDPADLKRRCDHFMSLLEIQQSDLVDRSYSDMLLEHA